MKSVSTTKVARASHNPEIQDRYFLFLQNEAGVDVNKLNKSQNTLWFLEFYKKYIHQEEEEQKRKRDAWLREARLNHNPGAKQDCYVCDDYFYIAHSHHILPLNEQYDLGFHRPLHCCVWLCPNHHSIMHSIISNTTGGSAWKFEEELGREEGARLITLFREYLELKVKAGGRV